MDLDPLIHAPTRLHLVALLAPLDEAEFSFVRDALRISDSALSKQAATLESADYLALRKRPSAGRSRTWLSLTPTGRAAFTTYLSTLTHLLDHPLQHQSKDQQ
ncbi:transcriptional regulator [Actinocorallia lasiicapitis]